MWKKLVGEIGRVIGIKLRKGNGMSEKWIRRDSLREGTHSATDVVLPFGRTLSR